MQLVWAFLDLERPLLTLLRICPHDIIGPTLIAVCTAANKLPNCCLCVEEALYRASWMRGCVCDGDITEMRGCESYGSACWHQEPDAYMRIDAAGLEEDFETAPIPV